MKLCTYTYQRVPAVSQYGCIWLSARLWHQLFFELMNHVTLGVGNILCHCESGYHWGPVAVGLTWLALYHSDDNAVLMMAATRRQPDMQWFLDELAKVRSISSVRPTADSINFRNPDSKLQALGRWAQDVASMVPNRVDYLTNIQECPIT